MTIVIRGMAYEVEDSKTNAFDDVVRQAQQNSAASNSRGPRPAEVTDLKITLWGNGFQVGEDGPFRDLNDPKNTQFIEELK